MSSNKDESEGVPLLQAEQHQHAMHQQQPPPPHMMMSPEMMAQYSQAAYGWYPEQPYQDPMVQQPPPPYYFPPGHYPPPPPQAPPPGAPFYPQAAGYYAGPPPQAYNKSPVPPSSRPPRSGRRGGSSTTPSPNGSARKTYEIPQSVQVAPVPPQPMGTNVQSGLPPLQDIFSADSSRDEQPLLSSINNQGMVGYGSTSSTNQRPASGGGKVWNAPPPSKKVQPVLVRTNSSGELNRTKNKTKRHRRINSDTPLRALHRRAGSGGVDRPPMHRRGDSASSLSRRAFSENRVGKPLRRRADSASSVHTFSSNRSIGSVVSNIAKSAMFGGIDEGGRVQMHFPFEAIRLVMIDPEDPKTTYRQGNLYLEGNKTDFEDFEDYQRITDDINQGLQPQWESLDQANNICGCQCNNCNGCLGKRQLLPEAQYMLAVKGDIYQRVLDEIGDAQSMPCGLFFCGHHEDVAHPSILIAVVVVSALFLSMALVAYYYDA